VDDYRKQSETDSAAGDEPIVIYQSGNEIDDTVAARMVPHGAPGGGVVLRLLLLRTDGVATVLHARTGAASGVVVAAVAVDSEAAAAGSVDTDVNLVEDASIVGENFDLRMTKPVVGIQHKPTAPRYGVFHYDCRLHDCYGCFQMKSWSDTLADEIPIAPAVDPQRGWEWILLSCDSRECSQ
jgi:hypothetical protein